MKQIEEILKGTKEERQLYAELAAALIRNQQYRKSVDILHDALYAYGDTPEDWEIYYLMGLSYQKQNKPKEAFQSWVKAARHNPSGAEECLGLAEAIVNPSNANEIKSWLTDQLNGRTSETIEPQDHLALERLKAICDEVLQPVQHETELESHPVNEVTPNSELQEVRRLLQKGYFQEALEKIKVVVQNQPGEPFVFLTYIRILIEGQLDLTTVRDLLKQPTSRTLLQNAEKEIRDELYRIITAENPNANTYYFAALMGLHVNVPVDTLDLWVEKAGEFTLRGEITNPTTGLKILQAEVADKAGRNADALVFYLETAKDYYYTGDYPAAMYYFNIVTTRDPDQTDAHRYLADVYYITSSTPDPPYNDETLTRKAYTEWHAAPLKHVLQKVDVWHYIVIARIHEVLFKFSASSYADEYWYCVLYLQRAMVHNPQDALYWTYLGRYFRNLMLEQNSMHCFDTAAALAPPDFFLEEERVILQLNTGEFDPANQTILAWQNGSRGPSGFKPYHKSWLGYISFHTGKREEAIPFFDAAIADAATDVFSYQMKMFCHWYDCKLTPSRIVANQILELKSKFTFLKETLAFSWAYFIAGNTAKAIEEITAYTDHTGEMNDEGFTWLQFFLYAGMYDDAESLAARFFKYERNPRILDELKESLDALTHQFNEDHPNEPEQASKIKQYVTDWKEKIHNIRTNNAPIQITPEDEILNKRQQYGIESGSVADIALQASLARMFLQQSREPEAHALYSWLAENPLFPEADGALEQIESGLLDHARTAIQQSDFEGAISSLARIEFYWLQNSATADVLRSIAWFNLEQLEDARVSIHLACSAGWEDADTSVRVWKEIRMYATTSLKHWEYLKFVYQNLETGMAPASITTPDVLQDRLLDVIMNSADDSVSFVTPIAIELSEDLIPPEAYTDTWDVITRSMPDLRKRIQDERGVNLPAIRFRPNAYIDKDTYIIMLDDVPQVFGNATINDYPAIITHLERVIIKHLELFMDLQTAVQWLQADTTSPTSVQENSSDRNGEGIILQQEQLVTFVQVLKSLLHEQVPITNKEMIISTYYDQYNEGDEVHELTQAIRSRLKSQLPVNQPGVMIRYLSEDAEKQLLDALRTDHGKVFLSITPKDCQEALTKIRSTLADTSGTETIALITRYDVLRPHLLRIAEYEYPRVIVSSESEILKENTVEA